MFLIKNIYNINCYGTHKACTFRSPCYLKPSCCTYYDYYCCYSYSAKRRLDKMVVSYNRYLGTSFCYIPLTGDELNKRAPNNRTAEERLYVRT